MNAKKAFPASGPLLVEILRDVQMSQIENKVSFNRPNLFALPRVDFQTVRIPVKLFEELKPHRAFVSSPVV